MSEHLVQCRLCITLTVSYIDLLLTQHDVGKGKQLSGLGNGLDQVTVR